MTTPTMQEMMHTFSLARDAEIYRQAGGEEDNALAHRAGWVAVIEKHFGPQLMAAFKEGAPFGRSLEREIDVAAAAYVACVLEEMKGRP